MQVRIFMGDEELTEEDIKNYICVNKTIQDTVNEVYYKHLKEKEKENEIKSQEETSVG